MADSDLRLRFPRYEDFYVRVWSLSQNARGLWSKFWNSGPHRFALGALILLVISVSFGSSAWQYALKETQIRWKKLHPPDRAVWISTLSSLGWSAVTHSEVGHKLIRSLPLSAEETGSAWITADNHFFILQSQTPEALGVESLPLIYQQQQGSVITGPWESLGSGWDALEKATLRWKIPRPVVPTLLRARKKLKPQDPLEIRY